MSVWLLVTTPVALLMGFGLLRWLETRTVYHPTQPLQDTPENHGFAYQDVWLDTDDGSRIHGWWFPCPGAQRSLLVCHGNGGNISTRLWMVPDIQKWGCSLFLFDYRGYGGVPGRPTERGLAADARAAYDFVRAQHAATEDPPIVCLGISLGGAVGAQLALERPLRGLILQSTLTCAADMAKRMFPGLPVAWMLRDKMRTIDKIGSIPCPILVAHSPDDLQIPFWMGEALHAKSDRRLPLFRLAGPHKEDGWVTTPAYGSQVQTFIDEVAGCGTNEEIRTRAHLST